MADKFDVQRSTPSIESSMMARIKQQRAQAAEEAAAAAEAEKMTQIRLAKNQEGPGAYAQRPGGIPYRGQRAEDQAVAMEQGLHRGRISPGQSDMSARLYRDGMRTGDMSGYYDFMATQDIGNLIGGEEVALHGLGRGMQAARAAAAARATRPKVTSGSVLAGDFAQSMRGAPSGSANMSITPEYEDAIRNEVFDTAPDYYARKPEEFEVAVQRAIDDFTNTGTITDANAPRSMSDVDIEQREALDAADETRLFDEADEADRAAQSQADMDTEFDPGTDPEVDVRHADEVGGEVTPDPAFMDPAVSLNDMDNVRGLQTKLRAGREELLEYSLDDFESEEFRFHFRQRVAALDSALERADVLEAELRRGAGGDPSRANDIEDELNAIANEFGIPNWNENVGTDIVRYPPTPDRPARGIQRDSSPEGPRVKEGGRTRLFGDADVDDDDVKKAHRAKRQEGTKRYTESGGVVPHGMSGKDASDARIAGYQDRLKFLSGDNYPLGYHNRKPDSMSDYDYFENIESPYRTNSALDTERHELAQRAELDRQAQGELDAELDPMRETEFKGPRIEDKDLDVEFDMFDMDVDYENVRDHYSERLLDGEFGDFPDLTREQAQKFAKDAADRYFRDPNRFTGSYHPLGTDSLNELADAIRADKTLTMSDIDALIEERLDAAGIPSNHPNRIDMVDRIAEDLDTLDRFDNDPDIQYQKAMPDLKGVARRALEGDSKKK